MTTEYPGMNRMKTFGDLGRQCRCRDAIPSARLEERGRGRHWRRTFCSVVHRFRDGIS